MKKQVKGKVLLALPKTTVWKIECKQSTVLGVQLGAFERKTTIRTTTTSGRLSLDMPPTGTKCIEQSCPACGRLVKLKLYSAGAAHRSEWMQSAIGTIICLIIAIYRAVVFPATHAWVLLAISLFGVVLFGLCTFWEYRDGPIISGKVEAEYDMPLKGNRTHSVDIDYDWFRPYLPS
jgi:hypothetical protein